MMLNLFKSQSSNLISFLLLSKMTFLFLLVCGCKDCTIPVQRKGISVGNGVRNAPKENSWFLHYLFSHF